MPHLRVQVLLFYDFGIVIVKNKRKRYGLKTDFKMYTEKVPTRCLKLPK